MNKYVSNTNSSSYEDDLRYTLNLVLSNNYKILSKLFSKIKKIRKGQMKIVKFITLSLALILMFGTTVQSQTKKKKSPYPQWSISPIGGLAFPIGEFGNNFKSGGNFGINVGDKVNKEVGFYGELGYFFFPNQTSGIPDGKMFEFTAGPRYYFTSKNLKSSIFLEAGLGGYNFTQSGYNTMIAGVDTQIPEVNKTDFGVNAGIGAVLNLGRDVDMIFKLKYHNVLNSDGSRSFVAPLLGIDVRL